MKTYSAKEFENIYGADAVSQFGKPVNTPTIFNPTPFKNVWTKAAEQIAQDIAFSRTNRITGKGDQFQGAKSAIIQGGLAPFRSIAAGFTGEGTKIGETMANAGIGQKLDTVGSFINKQVLPKGVSEKIGQTALDTIEGFNAMDLEQQNKQRNRLGVAEGLSFLLGSELKLKGLKDTGKIDYQYTINPNEEQVFTDVAKLSAKKDYKAEYAAQQSTKESTQQSSDAAFSQALNLREQIQAFGGEKRVGPQFTTSAKRVIAPSTPMFLEGTASRQNNIADLYDEYFTSAQKHIADVKQDPPLAQVGEEVGDAFNSVIKQQQAIGAVMGEELETYGSLRVSVQSAVQAALKQMSDSGLSFNPRTQQFVSFQGNAFAEKEVQMLVDFFAKVRLLGDTPTVRDLNNAISALRSELTFTKGSLGVQQVTNAERIINTTLHNLKQTLNPEINGISQLQRYWKANQAYSDLSTFIEEGSSYLGKVTQSGDYAKDASILKSSVQSLLNNGKKDWLLQLEALTDYPALDYAVIALQAMKDAGDYKGLSLLQVIKDQGIPTSKAGVTGAIIDKATDVGTRVVMGKPEEQTRAFLKSIGAKRTDLTKADKPVKAKADIPKTKEIISLEKQIAKNVAEQEKALRAGDITLLQKLKKIYSKLVNKLKAEIKFVKDNMGSEAGFANFAGGKAPKQYTKVSKDPDLKTKREVSMKDVAGNKFTVPEGTVLKPRINEKGQAIITVGKKEYVIPKNQYDNLKGQSDRAVAEPFAPELEGTKVTVRGTNTWKTQEQYMAKMEEKYGRGWKPKMTKQEKAEFERIAKADRDGTNNNTSTKYSQYTLPGGKSYREILVQAPETLKKGEFGDVIDKSQTYRSSHWDEPNVLFHLRMNDRDWNGKKVSFMEELQSDWARDARDGKDIPSNDMLKNWQIPATKKALLDAVDRDADIFAWINGAQTSERYKLSKQVENVKWETGKNADNGPKKVVELIPKGSSKMGFFVEADGIIRNSTVKEFEGKKLDEVLGKGMADSIMSKQSGTLEGEGLNFGGEWAHNLYDKQVRDIVKKLTGAEVKQADMGLGSGAKVKQWASEEFGTQLTYKQFENEGVGLVIRPVGGGQNYVVTDLLGNGKFKAVPKKALDVDLAGSKLETGDLERFVKNNEGFVEQFDISAPKATQQYIELTPEVKAKIKSEAPKFKMKNPSAGDALPLILLMLGGGAVAMEG